MTTRNCDAFMYVEDGEYIVLEGSRVSVDYTQTFVEKKSRPYRARLELEENGVIKDGVFTQDWKNPHISGAASVCAGHGISGREWKEV